MSSPPPPSKKEKLIFPDYTPQAVITEILLRLPVKTLLQYKSVSKSWYSLISSPNFINSQLAVAATRCPQNLIVHNCDYDREDYSSISLVNFHSCQVVAHFDYMPVDQIVGSANGIICVQSTHIYLWNPATKQYKIIHPHTMHNDDDDWSEGRAIGFGLDPIDDDLKVVVLRSPAYAVYSVKRNVWRKVRPNPTDFPYKRNFDVCVNGFLVSLGFSGMMAIDLNNAVLNCAINLPPTTFHFTIADFEDYEAQAYITEFNASIAVIASKLRCDNPVINLWALDDEACLRGGGIEASWTLMLNIDLRLPIQVVQAYLNTGEILLVLDFLWHLYNPRTKGCRCIPDPFRLGEIFKYKESLVTIAGFKQVNLNPPDDVITKILLCLPFCSLLRFKSVSKSWNSHISSPNFAKLQVKITETRRPHKIHIVHSYDYEDESQTSISLIDLDNCQTVAYLTFPFSQSEFPCQPHYVLVGSACGIVCVHATFSNVSRIYLWNPATKLSKRIPSHNIRNDDTGRVVLGFGFEPTSNDFKVVRMVSPSFSTEVYSANNNAWRNVEPNPIDFPINNNFHVCVNGFLFVAGRYGVIAFDLKTEMLNCAIKFPAPTFDDSITEFDYQHQARITEFRDFIAVIISTRDLNKSKIDLWALDDEACLHGHGIEASWTLILNIDINHPVQFIHGYFDGGDFLLLNEDVWYKYNPGSEEDDLSIPENTKARKFTDAFYCCEIFRYTNSLFEISGSKQIKWSTSEDDNEDDN